MDMDTSSGEEEDGQITKYEEEEEKDRKLFSKQPNPDDEPITLGDLSSCRLTRDMLAKHCMAPWFEDYVKGKSNSALIHIQLKAPHARWLGTLPDWTGA
jgi:RNA polymerase-associated protein RTF1